VLSLRPLLVSAVAIAKNPAKNDNENPAFEKTRGFFVKKFYRQPNAKRKPRADIP
jgi:hypothetical protein